MNDHTPTAQAALYRGLELFDLMLQQQTEAIVTALAALVEMATRCGGLDTPPNPSPSGYAALLYLYGLR